MAKTKLNPSKEYKKFVANDRLSCWGFDHYRPVRFEPVPAHSLNNVAIVKRSGRFYLHHIDSGYGIACERLRYDKFPQALAAARKIDSMMSGEFDGIKLLEVVEVLSCD